jgi:hypothetical protein
MKSFGRLLKRLRGQTPLETLGERTGLDPASLAQVESGKVVMEESQARHLLRQGFDLPRSDVDRLLLGIQLYDLGLKENAVRQLVIAVIRKEAPPDTQAALRQLAEQYQAV